MSLCEFDGNSDMYGLGIRVGFYLQWYGVILASWIAEEEVQGLRRGNALFISATFLALIIQTYAATLRAVEIYIILLLTFGAYYWYVPLYIWRLLVRCDPLRDPTRWPLVPSSRAYGILWFGLLVAVTCYQLWFWTTGINTAAPSLNNCPEYGFLFSIIPLNNAGFVAFNITFSIVLLCICSLMLCFRARCITVPASIRKRERRARRNPPSVVRLECLLQLQTFFNLIVTSIVTAATELTIQWNNIGGVNQVASAGQTIPMVIAIGMIAHIFYVYWVGDTSLLHPREEVRLNKFYDAPDSSSSESGDSSDEIMEDFPDDYSSDNESRGSRSHQHRRPRRPRRLRRPRATYQP
ncbi:hypothetical protein GQ53DRAFT_865701 [Thozetella sp. PMI_491]|nr:hypothetical protein GQ53DRAFT_865701 [Thozetella sp. PMI_491]